MLFGCCAGHHQLKTERIKKQRLSRMSAENQNQEAAVDPQVEAPGEAPVDGEPCCNQESCAHSASVATQSELGMAAFHHRNLENTLECNGNQQKFQKWFDGKEPSVVFATQPSPSLESLRSLNRILKKHWNAMANSSLGPIPVGDWESAHFFFGIAN